MLYLSVKHNPIVTHYVHNFTLFSREKRVKFEMLSLFSRNEKWNDFWFHSFREVKVKLKSLEIKRWNMKKILEKRDSRRALTTSTMLSTPSTLRGWSSHQANPRSPRIWVGGWKVIQCTRPEEDDSAFRPSVPPSLRPSVCPSLRPSVRPSLPPWNILIS